jgi:K+-transporting ATPase KdpF subunit
MAWTMTFFHQSPTWQVAALPSRRSETYGPDNLASGNVHLGSNNIGPANCVYWRVRQSMKGSAMEILTCLTAVVAALLLIYLFAALVRPEWF